MPIHSRTKLGVALALIGAGFASLTGCGSDATPSPSSTEDSTTSTSAFTTFRASRATFDRIGVERWKATERADGALLEGLATDARTKVSARFETGVGEDGRDVVIHLASGTTRGAVRIGAAGATPIVALTPELRTALERLAGDLKSMQVAAERAPAGGIGLRDYWDECYECANPPPGTSYNSSLFGSVSSGCAWATAAAYAAAAAAGVACATPQPSLPAVCAAAITAAAAAWAAAQQACAAPAPTTCYASWQCTDKYGPGWVCSGGGCVKSTYPGGGGGGSSNGGSGGIGCQNDWDCEPGFICTSLNNCGS